ncbi:MAG: hypothetical protein JOZ24_06745, partial [Candidatus Eremiobacteraeota bacterium]|nr:hypothetical protein [Candidatus Eremiobacteraeota bacterium]
MRVDVLVPDGPSGPAPIATPLPAAPQTGGAFGRLVDAASALLDGAQHAEAAFVAHSGGLQEMVIERARADIAL